MRRSRLGGYRRRDEAVNGETAFPFTTIDAPYKDLVKNFISVCASEDVTSDVHLQFDRHGRGEDWDFRFTQGFKGGTLTLEVDQGGKLSGAKYVDDYETRYHLDEPVGAFIHSKRVNVWMERFVRLIASHLHGK